MLYNSIPPSLQKVLKQYKPQVPIKPIEIYKNRQNIPPGKPLETFIQYLLHRDGYKIYSNVIIKDAWENNSEIDVIGIRSNIFKVVFKRLINSILSPYPHPISIFTMLFNEYLIFECKQYNINHNVPLQDVSKINTVANLLLIPPRNIVFVTTATYTPRCKASKITLINNIKLLCWIYNVCSPCEFKFLIQTLFPTNSLSSSNDELRKYTNISKYLYRIYYQRQKRCISLFFFITLCGYLYTLQPKYDVKLDDLSQW